MYSKSRFLSAIQCPKLVWYEYHRKDVFPEIDEATEYRFQEGNIVQEHARQAYEGVDISGLGFSEQIKRTKELVEQGRGVFEGAFMSDGLYARVDILIPRKGKWDIIEVKSSTKVKDVHIQDVSFQKHVVDKHIPVGKCYVMHINRDYVKNGSIDVTQLFAVEEIDTLDVSHEIDIMKGVVEGDEPDVDIGAHCASPYECPLMDICWKHVPEHNVTTLYWKNGYDLMEEGIYDMLDIPDDYRLNAKHRTQIACVKEGREHVDKEKIRKFLEGLEYPLHFLDFEAFQTAVPRYDGTRPYQQIVFQYSLHVQDEPFGAVKHSGHIATGDPRREVAEKLKGMDGGDIIVYNKSYEIGRLKEMQKYTGIDFTDVIKRVKDLIVPFRNFWYYHPKQHGSCSIKAVLPVLTDISYNDLEIGDGQTASIEYMRALNASHEERKKIFDALWKYCELDTLAMVKLVDRLWELIT